MTQTEWAAIAILIIALLFWALAKPAVHLYDVKIIAYLEGETK